MIYTGIVRGFSGPFKCMPQNLPKTITRSAIKDRDAFEDAQLMAEIAYRTHNESFWFAAMQALKAAYKGK